MYSKAELYELLFNYRMSSKQNLGDIDLPLKAAICSDGLHELYNLSYLSILMISIVS